MVVTARHECVSEHGTRAAAATVAPSAQAIHLSSMRRAPSRPLTSSGRSTNDELSSLPPTTSQRYQRAPLPQASSEGRNQAQLSTLRITRLSSPPRNFWNWRVHV